MLLYRQENRTIDLTNSCELPLQWKLRNLVDFTGHLQPSKLEDVVPGLSVAEFKLSFIGAEPTVILAEPLYLDVSFQEKLQVQFFLIPVPLTRNPIVWNQRDYAISELG